MPNTIYTYQPIDPAECIGDSVYKINNNNNFAANAIGDLETRIATISSLITAQYTAAVQEAVPAGAVHSFVQSTPPTGWISCEGVIVPSGTGTVSTSFGIVTANFANLHAAVGTKFGAAGQLPDLRGYFIRGHGTNTDGTASVGSLGRKQTDSFRAHNHSINDPGHRHTLASYAGAPDGSVRINAATICCGVSPFTSFSTTGITINNSGGNETRPTNISLLYCIKI